MGCVCGGGSGSNSSSQVDLAGKHGDHQNDGEARKQPRILDQEEDDLGGHPLLRLCNGVHLWKLQGDKEPRRLIVTIKVYRRQIRAERFQRFALVLVFRREPNSKGVTHTHTHTHKKK